MMKRKEDIVEKGTFSANPTDYFFILFSMFFLATNKCPHDNAIYDIIEIFLTLKLHDQLVLK